MIDSHVHLGLPEHRVRKGEELADLHLSYSDFMKEMDKAEVTQAVVFPIPHRDYDIQKSNEYILEAAMKSNGRLIPFCRINECLEQNLRNGFKGAKLHSRYEDFEIAGIEAQLRILEDYGVPLILHARFKNKPEQVEQILRYAPNLFLILAHCGRGNINTTEQVIENANALKKHDRVYFETSTMENPLTGNGEIVKQVCNIIGSDRVLIGTDYPFERNLYNYKCSIDYIRKIPLDKLALQKVTVDNIFHLLNLGDDSSRIRVRRTNKDDVPSLFEGLFSELTKQDQKYLALSSKLKYREHWEKHITAGNSCFVAILQDKIVGYMRCFRELKNDLKGDLWDFVVHPDYRKRGIAKQMMEYLHRRFSFMFAKTDTKNIPMQSLLKSFGYKPDNPDAQRVIKWTCDTK